MFSRSIAPVIGAWAGLTFGGGPATYGQTPPDAPIPQPTMPAVTADVAVNSTLQDLGRVWQPEHQLYQVGMSLPRQEQLDISLVLEGHKNWYVFAVKTDAPQATAEPYRALSKGEKEALDAIKEQVLLSPYYNRIENPVSHDSQAVSVVLFYDQAGNFYSLAYIPNDLQKAAGAALYQSFSHADSIGLSPQEFANAMADQSRGAGLKALMEKVDGKVSEFEGRFREQAGNAEGYMLGDARTDEARSAQLTGNALKYGGAGVAIVAVLVIGGIVISRRSDY